MITRARDEAVHRLTDAHAQDLLSVETSNREAIKVLKETLRLQEHAAEDKLYCCLQEKSSFSMKIAESHAAAIAKQHDDLKKSHEAEIKFSRETHKKDIFEVNLAADSHVKTLSVEHALEIDQKENLIHAYSGRNEELERICATLRTKLIESEGQVTLMTSNVELKKKSVAMLEKEVFRLKEQCERLQSEQLSSACHEHDLREEANVLKGISDAEVNRNLKLHNMIRELEAAAQAQEIHIKGFLIQLEESKKSHAISQQSNHLLKNELLSLRIDKASYDQRSEGLNSCMVRTEKELSNSQSLILHHHIDAEKAKLLLRDIESQFAEWKSSAGKEIQKLNTEVDIVKFENAEKKAALGLTRELLSKKSSELEIEQCIKVKSLNITMLRCLRGTLLRASYRNKFRCWHTWKRHFIVFIYHRDCRIVENTESIRVQSNHEAELQQTQQRCSREKHSMDCNHKIEFAKLADEHAVVQSGMLREHEEHVRSLSIEYAKLNSDRIDEQFEFMEIRRVLESELRSNRSRRLFRLSQSIKCRNLLHVWRLFHSRLVAIRQVSCQHCITSLLFIAPHSPFMDELACCLRTYTFHRMLNLSCFME
jgi:hypothetical protein